MGVDMYECGEDRHPPRAAVARRKLVVVGDGECGKTSLLVMYSEGVFPTVYVPTVFETYVAEVQMGTKKVELSLWDTAGQEDYDRLRPLSYPNANVILLCYSVDRPNSFHNLRQKWIPEIKHFCRNVPIVLVANKLDLREDPTISHQIKETYITRQEGALLSCKIGAHAFLECSAKSGYNVESVFVKAATVAMLKPQPQKEPKHRLCTVL